MPGGEFQKFVICQRRVAMAKLQSGAPAESLSMRTIVLSLAEGLQLACISMCAFTASAGETPQDSPALPFESAQELAKDKHNPFADQITVPLELSSSLDVGPGNGTTGGLNLQPAIPVSLGPNWKLITRPSLSLLLSEEPHRKLGFGDIELQTYLTPGLAGKWIWGVGPVFQAPTATQEILGTGKWCAGPAVGLVYMSGPWVNGILANHIWSFAGGNDRAAVSQSTLEKKKVSAIRATCPQKKTLPFRFFKSGLLRSFEHSLPANPNLSFLLLNRTFVS